MKYKSLYLLLLFWCSFFNAHATHIIGGEIYYDYLGNNNYRVFIAVYRDCETVSGAPYDNPLNLAVYSANNVLVTNVQIPFPGSVVLPVIFNNPCVVTPTGFCNERAIYTTILNLPPTAGGYTLTYQRCCRRPDIINIVDPGGTGLTLTTRIPGSGNNFFINSSPRFTNYPPLVLCNNDDLVFNHSATDPDGDQLVYELITPFAGASDFDPQPNPAPPPAYGPIFWATNFNSQNPLGPGATISINPTTGILTANPELTGLFVIGIRVKEFRNGVLIGQTDRDFIFQVINCNITLQALLTPQAEMTTFVSYCEGASITFENESYGATSYAWDFGVPNVSTDVSTQFEPTFSFPSPGIYNVTLVANPGWPCTDTSVQVFEVNENLTINYVVEDSICFVDNSFDFNGSFAGPVGTTFTYDFGPNASIATSNLLDVNDVNFTTSGFIPVTLTGSFGSCLRVFTDSIFIYPGSAADFSFPSNTECAGLTVNFTNNSANASGNNWDFGVPNINSDVSTQSSPSYTFPNGGTYNVTLIVNNNNICNDTLIQPISVFEPLSVAFTHNDSLCITENSFNFDGTVTGPPNITTISWNFGPNASVPTSNQEDVNNVVYNQHGVFPVTLTASFNSCSETASSTVTIFRVPEINFGIDSSLRCAPYPAQFIDLSVSDTPILYSWDFGDGNSSTEQNPAHIYTQAGMYDVTLQIETTEGCIATLELIKPNFLEIHPTPISNFSVSPQITDICHPRITFTDLSSGAIGYVYLFNDQGAGVNESQNPIYDYTSSGQKYPQQIVINEFGCQDTSFQSLYIEPFTVYIPNTFTPDGDEFNNIFNAIIYLETSSWSFKIYDRWGELLFESNDPKYGWDGTYGGKIVQDDTYTYILRYVSCEDYVTPHIITGHVNVLK